ncbi:MAG: LysE family translocator [Candidatus Methanomethyliaceae archaeon]|nr:LysE family translocator [Candidatus Methanomethyliaceae archaeon]MDW7970761.1 LysE family transporter [Nitrososphaerota archaeon]
MTWIELLAMVILISASGVMSPGPLSFAAIAAGSRSGWKSGLKIGFGHLIVELPIALAIAMGVAIVVSNWLSIFGGIFMIFFGFMTIKGARKMEFKEASGNPILLGIGLSALNPYFILWWITIGASLVAIAMELAGIFGVLFMYFSHVWMDFAWLAILAIIGHQGRRLGRFYPIFVAILGAILIAFGIIFIIRALL